MNKLINKPQFAEGDLVHVTENHPLSSWVHESGGNFGEIVGLASEHIIDMWIVQFDGPISEVYPFSTATIPHTHLERVNPVEEPEQPETGHWVTTPLPYGGEQSRFVFPKTAPKVTAPQEDGPFYAFMDSWTSRDSWSGPESDGYSIGINLSALRRYAKAYVKKNHTSTRALGYCTTSDGIPKIVEVPFEVFERLKTEVAIRTYKPEENLGIKRMAMLSDSLSKLDCENRMWFPSKFDSLTQQ